MFTDTLKASLILMLLSLSCCSGAAADPKPRGDRWLGLGVTEGVQGYEAAFSMAKSAGIQFLELPQQWDEIEVAEGQYESPFLAMANQVYPPFNTALVLSINPIDMVHSRIPARFRDKSLDDPELIAAFNRYVDFVFAGLPDSQIVAVSIGNEVDSWIGNDVEKWAEYGRLFEAARRHIKARWPEVPVGVKTTLSGVTGPMGSEIAKIHRLADAMMVTLYPLDEDYTVRPPSAIGAELDRLVKIADGKPLFMLEIGYPSGKANDSSEWLQAEFIDAVFVAWDRHSTAIKMINFIWLTDLSEAQTQAIVDSFPLTLPAFQSFLGTLGLCHHNGKPKAAFQRLKANAAARGW